MGPTKCTYFKLKFSYFFMFKQRQIVEWYNYFETQNKAMAQPCLIVERNPKK